MLVVLLYLAVLALAAFLTFAAFGDVSRTAPPAEGSSDFFSTPPPPSSSAAAASGESVRKKLFAADSAFALATQLPPQQQRMLSFLEDHCPAVPVRAASAAVLTHPSKFYEELKRQIRAAQESIFFSALYIGDGPLSTSFIGALEEKVDEVVANHEKRLASANGEDVSVVKPFEIGILLDYNRMHDRKNLVTVRKLLTTAHATEYRYSTNDKEEEGGGDGVSTTTPARESTSSGSPIKVRLYLYQGPCRWNHLFEPLGRAKEVLGVQHTKIFVFDGMHTILTGANLSDDYFATRMDRYVVYERNEHLSFFFLEMLKVLFAVSHPVVSLAEFVGHLGGSTDDLALQPRSPLLRVKHLIQQRRGGGASSGPGEKPDNGGDWRPSPSSPELSRRLTSQMVFPFTPSDGGRVSHAHGSPTLHKASDLVIMPNALGFDPSLETEEYEAHTRELCMGFVARMSAHFRTLAFDLLTANQSCLLSSEQQQQQSGTSAGGDDGGAGNGFDSLIFPTLQFGRVGVFHDSFIVKGLLSLASSDDHVYLTSPYLNVYSDFLDVLVGKAKEDSEATKATYPVRAGTATKKQDDNAFFFDVITASVKTNGWNGHRGFAGYIPFFYLQLERAFYFLAKAYGCLSRICIHEFTEKGLTFHAKGLYFCSADTGRDASGSGMGKQRGGTASGGAAPYLVSYGSTNYGYRSVHKDVEAEGFFFTFNQAFREQAREELAYLLAQSTTVAEEQFVGKEMGRFQPVISLVAQMGQDFL